MLILMTNPNHGAMYVYTEAEALRHELLGWTRKPEVSPAAEVKAPRPAKPKPKGK